MLKVKDKEIILKATREKQFVTTRDPHKTISGFLCRNLAGQEAVERYIQSNERGEKNCQPRILYPAKLSFRNEGKIKTKSS